MEAGEWTDGMDELWEKYQLEQMALRERSEQAPQKREE
jgi:hypothetical protein